MLFAYVMPVLGRAGLFGPALQQKIIEQQATNLPMLLAGRTEPPMSITAIAERPLLGWGNALKLTPDLYAKANISPCAWATRRRFHSSSIGGCRRRPLRDAFDPVGFLGRRRRCSGSAAAGVAPAIACIGVVWNSVRLGAWAPLAVTVAFQAIWDLLFNPCTYNMVLEFACLALFYCAVHFRADPSAP